MLLLGSLSHGRTVAPKKSFNTPKQTERLQRKQNTLKNACLRDVKDKTHMEGKRILTVFSCAFLGEDGRNGPGLSLAVTSRPPHLAVTSSFCWISIHIYSSVNLHRPWQIGGRSVCMCPLKIVFCHSIYQRVIHIQFILYYTIYTLYTVLDNLNPLFFACSCFFLLPPKNRMRWKQFASLGRRRITWVGGPCIAHASLACRKWQAQRDQLDDGPWIGWHYGLRGFPMVSL